MGQGGLFTSDGTEIKNPKAFVANMRGSSESSSFGPVSGKGGSGNSRSIYKADGTEIRNPVKFVSNIANYTGGLFTSDGQEIRNPQAFVGNMAYSDGASPYGKGSSPISFSF